MAPGKNSGGAPYRQLCPAYPSADRGCDFFDAAAALVKGRKAAQERFSEEVSGLRLNSPETRFSNSTASSHKTSRTRDTQQAWIDSRNLINIATEWKDRQIFFATAQAQFQVRPLEGVIPKPRVFTSGARNLPPAGPMGGRSFAPPEKRLRSGRRRRVRLPWYDSSLPFIPLPLGGIHVKICLFFRALRGVSISSITWPAKCRTRTDSDLAIDRCQRENGWANQGHIDNHSLYAERDRPISRVSLYVHDETGEHPKP